MESLASPPPKERPHPLGSLGSLNGAPLDQQHLSPLSSKPPTTKPQSESGRSSPSLNPTPSFWLESGRSSPRTIRGFSAFSTASGEGREERFCGMPWPLVRLGLLLVALSLFCIVPNESENYFPNNAFRPLQAFLSQGIGNTTGKVPSSGTMSFLWSFFVTIDIVGVVLGSMLVPVLTSKFSRPRATLIGIAAFSIPGRLMQIISTLPLYGLWPLLIIGKLIASCSNGIIESILPILLSEVSPAGVRGRLGILLPLGICVGAIVGATLGLSAALGTAALWPMAYVIFAALTVPAVPLLWLIPDTPARLLHTLRHRPELAEREALDSLRFYQGSTDLGPSREDARVLAAAEGTSHGLGGWVEVMRSQAVRGPLKLALAVSCLYFPVLLIQCYSTLMMTDAGVPDSPAEWATFGLKVVSFVEFFACMGIADRVARRTQLMVGTVGCLVSFLFLATSRALYQYLFLPASGAESTGTSPASWAFLLSLFLLQISINFGIRPLYWVIVPEIFPYRYRAAGKSLIMALSAIFCTTCNLIFYQLLYHANFVAYLVSAVPVLLSLAYCLLRFPETSGQQLHEIFAQFAMDEEDLYRPILEAESLGSLHVSGRSSRYRAFDYGDAANGES